MSCILKTAVRLGVIGAIVGAGALLIAGPERLSAVFNQAQTSIHAAIDEHIDDPIALRNQMRELEREYPKRISEIQGELAQVNTEMSRLERELAVSQRVVQLTQGDMDHLDTVIARASAQADGYQTVSFDGQSIELDEAYEKANRISQLHTAYTSKVQDAQRDLGFLGQQKDRLVTLLEKIQLERAQFNAKLWQLEQEVSAIARNDRLIDIVEERQQRLDEFKSPYSVASLDQFNARLADKRAAQEARLEMLFQSSEVDNYEQRAKYLIDHELGVKAPAADEQEADPAPAPEAGRMATRQGG